MHVTGPDAPAEFSGSETESVGFSCFLSLGITPQNIPWKTEWNNTHPGYHAVPRGHSRSLYLRKRECFGPQFATEVLKMAR